MKNTIFVVTRAINQYDQDGDYFVAAFLEKPSFQDLKKLLPKENDTTIGKLLRGGGRQKYENEWFFLTEIKSGELYIHSE